MSEQQDSRPDPSVQELITYIRHRGTLPSPVSRPSQVVTEDERPYVEPILPLSEEVQTLSAGFAPDDFGAWYDLALELRSRPPYAPPTRRRPRTSDGG